MGTLTVGETQRIQVKLYTQVQGPFEEKIVWSVEGSEYNPVLYLKGQIGQPDIVIAEKFIDYGIVGYGICSDAIIHVHNNSLVNLQFKLHILQEERPDQYCVCPSLLDINAQVIVCFEIYVVLVWGCF